MRAPFLALLLACGCVVSPAQAGSRAVAGPGEGIWSLLRRHGVAPTAEAVAAFRNANRDLLGGSDALLRGRSYRLPGGSTRHPLFGDAYAVVPSRSDRLKGHVYYIVAGHGGPDPGTTATFRGRPIAEDEIAYDTALRVCRELISHGATVYSIVQDPNDGIRDGEWLPLDTDEVYLGGAPISRDHRRRLAARVAIVNGLYEKHRKRARSQRVLSIHVDATEETPAPRIDVHFLAASASGRRLSTTLSETVRARYADHQPERRYRGRVKTRDLDILVNTKPVAVLVELGNIKNASDQIRLVRPGNRQALAEWIVDGLLAEVAGVGL